MGRDELFQAKEEEIHLETLPKVRVFRVVAVAENHLAPKKVSIIVQLLFNIGKLGVELIVLRRFGRMKIFVRHSCTPFKNPKEKAPDPNGQMPCFAFIRLLTPTENAGQ